MGYFLEADFSSLIIISPTDVYQDHHLAANRCNLELGIPTSLPRPSHSARDRTVCSNDKHADSSGSAISGSSRSRIQITPDCIWWDVEQSRRIFCEGYTRRGRPFDTILSYIEVNKVVKGLNLHNHLRDDYVRSSMDKDSVNKTVNIQAKILLGILFITVDGLQQR